MGDMNKMSTCSWKFIAEDKVIKWLLQIKDDTFDKWFIVFFLYKMF